jgi:hypothetical protein
MYHGADNIRRSQFIPAASGLLITLVASAIDWPYLKLISTPASPPNFTVEFGCNKGISSRSQPVVFFFLVAFILMTVVEPADYVFFVPLQA